MTHFVKGRLVSLAAVLALSMAAATACGENADGTDNPTPSTGAGNGSSLSPASSPPATGQSSGLTVVIGGDGILGAKDVTAKVGDRLTIVLQNNMAGQAELTVFDPAGQQVGKVEVSGRGQGQTTVQLASPGAWSYKVDSSLGLHHTYSITVS